MRKNPLPYLVSVAIALSVGGLAGFLTRGGMAAYAALAQPPLAPPGWLFPPVWTVLYLLMGVAAARVYVAKTPCTVRALTLYGAQLIVNFFWPFLFFNLEARFFAFLWLLLLFALVVLTTIHFYRISKKAGYLMLPYLLWLLFAGYLNFFTYLLNR